MSDSIDIPDGYTTTRTVPGIPGLHPELTIVYRPALARERIAYRSKSNSSDPTVLDLHEIDLVQKYTVSLNGRTLAVKDEIARIKPIVRQHIVDLILGYIPADEGKDAKN